MYLSRGEEAPRSIVNSSLDPQCFEVFKHIENKV